MSDVVAEFARAHIAGSDLWTMDEMPPALMSAMGQAGLFRIGLPASHGGTGGGYPAIAAAEQTLMAVGGISGIGTIFGGHQMVARYYFVGHGSKQQQDRYLPALASGELTVAVAISEPEVGAHPKKLTTTAQRDAAGWVLNGRKAYVTNGPLAGLFVVLAITAIEGERKRYSAFLVPRNAPGLGVHHAPTSAGSRPAGHVSLTLDNCHVGADAMLGAEGTAYETMALGFRDAEDGVGTAGMVGKLRHILGLLAREYGAEMPDEIAAELGALAGLVELTAEATAALALAGEDGTLMAARPQALNIGARQLGVMLVARIRALPVAPGAERAPRIAALLASIEGGMNVARGPRLARVLKLGRSL